MANTYQAPIVKKAVEANIPVISEIEFAGRYVKGKEDEAGIPIL